MLRRVADVYLEREFPEPRDRPVPGAVAAAEGALDEWAGVYWDESTGGFATLELAGGGLAWSERRQELAPTGGTSFAFRRSDDAVVELHLSRSEGERTLVVDEPAQRRFR